MTWWAVAVVAAAFWIVVAVLALTWKRDSTRISAVLRELSDDVEKENEEFERLVSTVQTFQRQMSDSNRDLASLLSEERFPIEPQVRASELSEVKPQFELSTKNVGQSPLSIQYSDDVAMQLGEAAIHASSHAYLSHGDADLPTWKQLTRWVRGDLATQRYSMFPSIGSGALIGEFLISPTGKPLRVGTWQENSGRADVGSSDEEEEAGVREEENWLLELKAATYSGKSVVHKGSTTLRFDPSHATRRKRQQGQPKPRVQKV